MTKSLAVFYTKRLIKGTEWEEYLENIKKMIWLDSFYKVCIIIIML